MFDIWRAGFIRRGLQSVVDTAGITAGEVTWLPACAPFHFVADPFAIERDGMVTVFVEAFDYRVRRGEIHFYQYDAGDTLIRRGIALAEPFHLSYPSLIEENGELYMLPEGYKSGALTLYRCTRFPDRWEPVQRLGESAAIDATVVRYGDRWWMFHALAGPSDRAMRELHVAWSFSLLGPWTPHASNPVRSGFEASRPGGTAFEHEGRLHLPVQDCTASYGAAINLLRIDTLTPDDFAATVVRRFGPDGVLEGFDDGLHTLSGLGGVTCVDVKQIRRSSAERWIRVQYKIRRLLGLNGPRRARVGQTATAER